MIDKLVGYVDPQKAVERAVNRQKLKVINQGYSSHGANTKKKSLMGWMTQSGSATEDIEQNIETLRERSRDLYMGAPIATGALKTLRTNIIGSGLRLNAQIDADFLGMNQEEADQWETSVEREFDLWADSVNCDLQRMKNFYDLQQLAFLSWLMSGDCFILLPTVQRVGTPYETCIQIIEADRVCNPNGALSAIDTKIINGVEIDSKGEVIAYHIASKHPKSIDGLNNSWTRVERFGKKSGRQNVLHLIEFERPEQRRGVPVLSPVVESLKQLSRYTEAELMAAVISGMYTLFVESESPNQEELGGISEDDAIDGEDDTSIEVGNGAVNFLSEGEKVHETNPGRPNTAFDGFVTSICRQVGVALEIPYEVLMKHFTSSYSASRGALLEAWKMFRMRRDWVSRSLCQPIYEEFLSEAIAKGRVKAPGFFDDPLIRKAYCSAEWNGPSQGQLDPLKEVNAAEKRVSNGFSTRTRETIELTGGDFFQNHRLRIIEEQVRKEAGFINEVGPVADGTEKEVKEKDED